MNIIKSLFAFLVMLVATLLTASDAQAFALGNHAGGFFLGTLDCNEENKPSTRNLCRENGWLNYDTLSGCSVATNKTGINFVGSGSGRGSSFLGNSKTGAIGLKSSPNQLNKLIKQGNSPAGLKRVDVGKVKGEQTHIHFNDKGGSALNIDGTWKHGGTTLTNKQSKWLKANGWTLPQ